MNGHTGRNASTLAILLVGVVAAGCADDPQRMYLGHLTDDAVVIERQLAARYLASVRPLGAPIRGSVTIDLPMPGLACAVAGDCPVINDDNQYVLTVTREQANVRNRSMAEALVRARAFESIVINLDCQPYAPTVGSDWTIYSGSNPAGVATWYLYRRAIGRIEAIQFDAQAAPAVKLSGWVDAVLATVRKMELQLANPRAEPIENHWYTPRCWRDSDAKHAWRATDVVDVAMSPDAWLRTETVYAPDRDSGPVFDVPWSGPAWTGIFAGGPQSPATFAINSTTVQVDLVGVLHHQCRYRYDGTLTWNGRSWPIHGEANSGSMGVGRSMEGNVLDMVRAGAADAARQVRAIMAADAASRN